MLQFVHPLARLWKGFARGQRRPIRRSAGPRLRLEWLEVRATPAGNVVSSQVGTTLYLTGVNAIGLSDQDITITGVAQDAVSIQGNNGTTVNLGGGPADYANVVNIVINMNNGDDIVTATNLALSGKLTFNGGAGNDSLTLDGAIGANVIGALTYSGGDGNDVLTFQNGPNQVNGLLAINNGGGDNAVLLGTTAGDSTSVGSMTLQGGPAGDTLAIGGDAFSSAGKVIINNGGGVNSSAFEATTDVSIGDALAISGGSDVDVVAFGIGGTTNVNLAGVTINNGSGFSSVAFAGATHNVNGDLKVTNGTGFDVFTAAGNGFFVAGALTIFDGAGGSAVAITSDTNIAVAGVTTITNFAGADSTVFGAGGVGDVSLGPVVIANGADDASVVFGASTHTINGRLVVTDGVTAGTDVISATGDSFHVTGPVSISNGSAGGGTTVNFGTATDVTFDGLVAITNQTGDDTELFGVAGTTVTFAAGVKINNGAGQGSTIFAGALVAVTGDVSVRNGTSAAADVFDTSAADQFTVTGNVTIADGDGPSSTSIGGTTQGSIGGTLSISAGTGSDSVVLQFMDFHTVTIALGNGASAVSLDATVTTAGNVAITAGTGDQAIAESAAITGNLSITTGSGADALALTGAVTGNLAVNTGDGDDAVALDSMSVGGTTSLYTGGGADAVGIDQSAFSGSTTINLAAGDDTLNIATNTTGITTVFAKSVAIYGGFGNDTVTIGIDADPDNRAIFQASVLFSGDGGTADTLVFGPPKQNSFFVLPVLSGWEVVA